MSRSPHHPPGPVPPRPTPPRRRFFDGDAAPLLLRLPREVWEALTRAPHPAEAPSPQGLPTPRGVDLVVPATIGLQVLVVLLLWWTP